MCITRIGVCTIGRERRRRSKEEDYKLVGSHKVVNMIADDKTCHTTNAWVPSTFDHDQQLEVLFQSSPARPVTNTGKAPRIQNMLR